jgi:hypothetical protein
LFLLLLLFLFLLLASMGLRRGFEGPSEILAWTYTLSSKRLQKLI